MVLGVVGVGVMMGVAGLVCLDLDFADNLDRDLVGADLDLAES